MLFTLFCCGFASSFTGAGITGGLGGIGLALATGLGGLGGICLFICGFGLGIPPGPGFTPLFLAPATCGFGLGLKLEFWLFFISVILNP